MFKHRVASLLALLFVVFAQSAQAFFDPPYITPTNPIAGETVSVNIYGGICDFIVGEEGYPQITQVGNAIRIREYGYHYEPGDELCGDGVGTATDPIGAFAPGDYTLTVELAYLDEVSGASSILPIGVVSFAVTAPAPPTSVRTTDPLALFVLVLLLSAAVWATRTRRPGLLLIALTCASFGARAQGPAQTPANQTIQVLLTNAPGAPTPEQVVSWINSSPRSPSPPLHAFTVKSPQGGDFLIPDRASGDFLTWLNANPHSARYALEHYMLVTFAVTDIPAALAALRADPYVAAADEPLVSNFSSVELGGFSVDADPAPRGDGGQYGRDDLNTDEAWALTGGGYALIGQVDMGLYEVHPALQQFNSGGTYVGGNFIKAASKDVGLTGQPAQAGFDPTNVDEAKPMFVAAGACTSVDATVPPAIAGHGTHVAGLLAANGDAGLGVQGTAKAVASKCGRRLI